MEIAGIFGRSTTRIAAALLLGASTIALSASAQAGTILYPAGSNNPAPIVLTDNSTIMSVGYGTATQSGFISGTGGLTVMADGSGPPNANPILALNHVLNFTANNTYTGVTTVDTGTLIIGDGGTSGSILGDATTTHYSAILFDRSDTLVYAGSLTGIGNVYFDGGGRFILTGSDVVPITVRDNTILQVGNGGTSGTISGTVNMTTGGRVIFNRSDDVLFKGNFVGGDVQQSGSGKLIIEGEIQADLVIDPGTTVQLGDNVGQGVTDNAISNNGQLIFTLIAGRTEAINTIISGTGNVVKTGAGLYMFGGANTYTGTTTVAQGTLILTNDYDVSKFTVNPGATLQVGNFGISGSMTSSVNVDGTLAFARRDDIVYSGAISGSGALRTIGLGSVTLTGANTYTGGTTIFSGSLIIGNGGTTGSILGDVAINQDTTFGTATSLAFNRADTVTYSGTVSGAGTLRQNGAGTLILTGTDQAATTLVADGRTLQIGNGGTGGSISSAVSLGTGSTLVFNRSDNATLDGSLTQISGAGLIRQSGSGALVVTGNVGAGIVIDSGTTVQFGNGTLAGASDYSILNNGHLIFNAPAGGLEAMTSVISGPGDILKTGLGTTVFGAANTYAGITTVSLGTLVLSGTNTYTGSKFVVNSGGTLQIGNGGTTGFLSGDIAVAGALAFNRSDAVVYSSAISGTGGVQAVGNGSVTLTGANTYTGLTVVGGQGKASTLILAGANAAANAVINGGSTLQVGNGGTVGSINGDIVNNGTLNFSRSDAYTYSGVISGTGQINQLGSNLILTGANTYSGGTVISTGSQLQVGNGGTSGSVSGGGITNNGTLLFNRSDRITYGSWIAGSGMLIKAGAGTLVLNADSNLAGGTQVNAGTLLIGDAASPLAALRGGAVMVSAGATLGGFGQALTAVNNSGTVSPGDGAGSIATLAVGNYTQSAAATLAMDVSATAADRLIVNGTANLGGTLTIASSGAATNTFTILSAASVSGTFSSVTGISPGDTFSVTYGPTSVVLTVQSLSNLQLYSDFGRNTFMVGQSLNDTLFSHIGARHCAKNSCPELSLWYQGQGGVASFDANGGSGAFNSRHAGFIGGADYNSEDGYRFGISASYDRAQMNVAAAAGRATTDSFALTVNAGLPVFDGNLDALGLYMSTDGNAQRTLAAGNGPLTASTHPRADVFGMALQYGQPIISDYLSANARLSYLSLSRNGLAETGAAPFNFMVDSGTSSGLYGDIGLKLKHDYTLRSGALLTPELYTAIRTALDAPVFSVSGGVGQTNLFQEYSSSGADFLLGLGISAQARSGDTYYLRALGREGAHEREATIAFGVSIPL